METPITTGTELMIWLMFSLNGVCFAFAYLDSGLTLTELLTEIFCSVENILLL